MLTGYFFRETRVLIMIIMVIVIGGISSLLALGRQEDPTITNLFATVTTVAPGMSPTQIEELISTKIEDQIQGMPDVTYFNSSSFRDASVVAVAVRDTLPDDEIERVWIELREAVDRASLLFPRGVGRPQVNTLGINAFSTVIALETDDPRVSPAIAARFARLVEAELRDIPDTRYVQVFAMPKEEILVSVDPYLAAANGISVDQVADSIQATGGQNVAGSYVSGNVKASVAVKGDRGEVDSVRSIPVITGKLESIVRVGDVASVTRQARTPPDAIGRSDAKPAILIGAVVEDGAQVDRWMEFVHEDLEALSQQLPKGLSLAVKFDQSVYTIERLNEVGLNMLFGMVLVTAVLVVTLGWRAAMIVAVILPMVSLATMISFRMLDLPLHQMSIAGLIVSLGLVVDAAIVTTDTVRRRLSEGHGRQDAADTATRRLFIPLAASTITTVLTFLPMILLPGNTGDFVSTIAIAVSVMVFWSFALALVLTAPMAAHLLKNRTTASPKDGPSRRGVIWHIQNFLIRHPFLSIGASLVLPVLGFVLSQQLTPQFFPLVERNQFHISVEMPSHATVNSTDDVVKRMNIYLEGVDGITGQYWVSGGSAPSFYYNISGGTANAPGYGQGMITTQSPRETRRILETLQQDLSFAFPEARVTVQELAQGPPVGAPVEILIYGPELDELRRIGAEVQGAIAALPEAAQVSAALTGGLPQLRYQIDSDAANLMALDEAVIARQLEAGLSGVLAGSLSEGTQQIPIRVQFSEDVLRNSDVINDLPILTNAALLSATDLPTVPLSVLATPSLETVDSFIFRTEGERLNYVLAYPTTGVLPEILLGEALAAIEAADIVVPAGYRLDLGGDSDQRQSTVDGLMSSILLIVTLSLGTLVLTFRSFRITLGALIVAGLSAGLSLLSVAIMGFPFGINALIGVIGSVGVSLNAAIIVFTALQGNPRVAAGDVDAATQEVLSGARHIISTTLTTFGGFLPLLFSGGLFWPPFAAAIAGGVLLSGTLAFLFAPAYFCLVMAKSRGSERIGQLAEQASEAPRAAQYVAGASTPFSTRKRHPLRGPGLSRTLSSASLNRQAGKSTS